MNGDNYQEAVDRIKNDYDEQIRATLGVIGNTAVSYGWDFDGVVNEVPDDEYRWCITVTTGDRRGVNSVDFTFSVKESLVHEGSTDGVNFSLEVADHDGHVLGKVQPCNYTPDAWVDASDKEAVEARFDFIDQEATCLIDLLPEPRHIQRRYQAERGTTPHGRCDTLTVCVEHAANRRMPSCKPLAALEKTRPRTRRRSG